MTAQPLALTIDIGTSSTRVLLWDTAGRETPGVHAQVKYAMHTTPDGGVEMPAPELEQHVAACVDEALKQAGDRVTAIRVVGMSAFWHSLVGLDAQGVPITPIYSWADTRSGPTAQRLRAELDAAAIYARTGCMIHPSYYPAKLVWLRNTQPALYARVARWASPSEYLFGRWFGECTRQVSLSMASGTGLLNQDRCEWDAETLRAIDVSAETLAPIVDLAEHSCGLHGDYAARWPSLHNALFFPAVGDGACGNVGSGCVSPERFAINLGTSGAIRALYQEEEGVGRSALGVGNPMEAMRGEVGLEIPDAQRSEPNAQRLTPNARIVQNLSGLWRYRVDRRRPLVGASFSDGGIVYEWMARTLRLPEADELERRLAALPPATDLIFLPFLAGERSLGWHPNAHAVLTGLNLNTDPVDIAHAAMQAVALRFALAAQRLRTLFPQAHEIVASGGALSHSGAWAQMFADAIGQPLILAEEAEASSRGAALLALEAAGHLGAVRDAPARLGATFTPDPARHAVYADLLARQEALYEQLIESTKDTKGHEGE
jgi:gluconokinase